MSETAKTASDKLSGKLVPVLTVVLIGAAFAVGLLWGRLQAYEKGGSAVGAAKPVGTPPSQDAAAPTRPTTGTASVDDDPVLGDPKAPITMIEFSDYECPFCKRFYDDTLGQITKDYIDTGQVKLVYRDLPLSFHDPMATREAVAANCAREQGDDTAYFAYHDEIFNRTVSNGNGLSEEDLVTIASDIGLDVSAFGTCLEDPAQEDEVKKDVADAGQAGATGTPTFIIGKTTESGEIEGDLVVGAQPYAAFQAVIDPRIQ